MHEQYDEIVFYEPTEAFFARLDAGPQAHQGIAEGGANETSLSLEPERQGNSGIIRITVSVVARSRKGFFDA